MKSNEERKSKNFLPSSMNYFECLLDIWQIISFILTIRLGKTSHEIPVTIEVFNTNNEENLLALLESSEVKEPIEFDLIDCIGQYDR